MTKTKKAVRRVRIKTTASAMRYENSVYIGLNPLWISSLVAKIDKSISEIPVTITLSLPRLTKKR